MSSNSQKNPSASASRRPRSAQGDGALLRAEIVNAATALLVDTGNPELVTLRAVARSVGIAAPSIYLHFESREDLLVAVANEANDRFTKALQRGDAGPSSDPIERLNGIAMAYVRFAAKQRGAYQVLFNGLIPESASAANIRSADEAPTSFSVLYAASKSACDAATNYSLTPMQLSLALWSSLHGYVVLKANLPRFPWPSATDYIASLFPLLPLPR